MNKRIAVLGLLALGALSACDAAPTDQAPTEQVLPEVPLDETPLGEQPLEGTPTGEVPAQETPTQQAEPTITPEAAETEAGVGAQAEAASISRLTGYSLQLQDGTPLAGQVIDAVVDLQEPGVVYLVVRLDEAATAAQPASAVGTPVPITLASIDPEQELVTLQATLDRVLEAPVVELGSWPDPADPEWDAVIRSYWEVESTLISRS